MVRKNQFDGSDESQGQGQVSPSYQPQFWSSESKPFSFDIYEKTPNHLLYIKNQLAEKSKQTSVSDAMFEGPAANMTADEYQKWVNEQSLPEKARQVAIETAKYDDSEIEAKIQALRAQLGLAPQKPGMPDRQMPNDMQLAAAGLAAILGPEFAFESLATPFQAQELSRQEQFANAMVDYENNMAQHQALMKLAGFEVDQAVDAANRNFAADLSREQTATDQNFALSQATDSRNFSREMFAKQVEVDFVKMNFEQKQRLAFTYLQAAQNPNSTAEEREFAASIFNRLMPGSTIEAFTGKTLSQQAAELEMQIAKDSNQRAQNADDRAGQLFPYQLEGAKVELQSAKIRLKFLPEQLQADLDTSRANIANITDQIRSRQFGDNLALSEQDRAYLGMTQEGVLGSLRNLGTQLEELGLEERNLTKERESADKKRQAEIDVRLGEIKTQKSALINESSDLQGQLDSLNEILTTKAGFNAGSSNLGESVLGTPYSWGGGGAGGASKGIGKGAGTVGFDCSGLTSYIAFQDFGAKIPRTAQAQWESKDLDTVADQDLQEGDFLYFRNGNSWHTGVLIIKNGEAYIRHAPQTGSVVKDQKLEEFEKHTSKKYVGAKRVRRKES